MRFGLAAIAALIVLTVGTTKPTFAQGIPGPNTPDKNHDHGDTNPAGKPDNSPNKKENVPFDAGITALLGAGVAYGVKKARDKRKMIQSKL